MRNHRIGLVVFALLLLAIACDRSAGSDAEAASLSEGDPAPDFDLPSAGGGTVALSDFHAKKPVLLYFSMGPG